MCQEKTKDITNVSVMTEHLLQKVKCKLLWNSKANKNEMISWHERWYGMSTIHKYSLILN
jgi:hypothetical protein